MKSLFLALMLMAAGVSCAANPPDIQKKTHIVEEATLVSDGPSFCSATAIGPHTLLYASHCEEATDFIRVDGQSVEVVKKTRDMLDHTILFLKGVTFSDWAAFTTDKQLPLGEDVMAVGNPGRLRGILHKGYFAGQTEFKVGNAAIPEMLIEFNGYYGDSGAGVFNSKGELIGVISMVVGQKDNGIVNKYMGVFPLGFTKKELEEARTF